MVHEYEMLRAALRPTKMTPGEAFLQLPEVQDVFKKDELHKLPDMLKDPQLKCRSEDLADAANDQRNRILDKLAIMGMPYDQARERLTSQGLIQQQGNENPTASMGNTLRRLRNNSVDPAAKLVTTLNAFSERLPRGPDACEPKLASDVWQILNYVPKKTLALRMNQLLKAHGTRQITDKAFRVLHEHFGNTEGFGCRILPHDHGVDASTRCAERTAKLLREMNRLNPRQKHNMRRSHRIDPDQTPPFGM